MGENNMKNMRGVQVIFLHGGSASKDETEQDGECQQSQVCQKRQRGVLSGEQKQAGGLF